MSASSPNLKHPAVVGFLILGAVAVTILNIQTFGTGKRPTRRLQTAVMDQPALPPDLALLVQEAMSARTDHPDDRPQPPRNLPRLSRDPFQEKVSTRRVLPTGEVTTPTKSRSAELVCSAVMTGSKRPSAMINGKFYSPGDAIGNWTLAWIASTGVTLQTSQGHKKFLPLTNHSSHSGALEVKVGSHFPNG